MIVSLSEPSCSPNVGAHTLSETRNPLRQTRDLSVASPSSVGEPNRSRTHVASSSSVTFLQVNGTSLYSPNGFFVAPFSKASCHVP
ncbi:hypothetical protein PBY51_008139 [Eleginops maclovinus]|uniref:Uncharacterized protein n=1 Tax=Eleginops maclovinus TaxID=56733 RepID=A0AAN7X941_ELEMC|nr:hypothetical protein PBY51_008139 [Eleginops maclovinus]